MPPRNKKQKPNAFMTFAAEWKAQHAPENWTLQRCIPDAGKVWEKMSIAERQPYVNKAKNLLDSPMKSDDKNKIVGDARRNCMGDLVADVEKETKSLVSQERMNIRTIDKIIRQVVAEGKLESTRFYFLMVNYFTKSLSGDIYVPAEIAFAEFSLEGGVSRVYHSHINPGVSSFGQRYQTEKYVNDTHRLPLPPNALGEENMTKIYVDLLSFLDKSADNDGKLPSVYTTKDVMPIVENVLAFMKDPCHPDIRVLPIEYLFFVVKDETCKACGLDRPKTQFITDAVFQRDKFEHQRDIGCQYHEDMDRSKYCAQSYVMRWGYQFADYICLDLAILLAPGTHMPNKKNSAFIVVEPRERTENRKRKDRNGLIKQEISEECNNNSVEPGTSSMLRGPRDQSNDSFQIKNEDTNNSYEDERNVASTPFIKTENSSDEDEELFPPPPPTNINFGVSSTTKDNFSIGHNNLPNNNAHRMSGRSNSPLHNIRQPSPDIPERRNSNGFNELNGGPRFLRQNVTRSRDGSRSTSRTRLFENDRHRSPSLLFDEDERRSNRDRRMLNRNRSRSPIHNMDTHRRRSPLRGFNRNQSHSPVRWFNRDSSKSPLHTRNRDRSNSPLHNFNRDQIRSPIRSLDRDHSRSPLHMFDRDLNRSSKQQQRGRSPIRFVNEDHPLTSSQGHYHQDNRPMIPNNEGHLPLRNQLGNYGEQDGSQNVSHSCDGQWQRNCPPMHNIPLHSDQNVQHQHMQTIESQQQTFGNANIWQQNASSNQRNQSYVGGPLHQQQNDFDNGNHIVHDIREYLQNRRGQPSQSPIIQVIIPPEIAPPHTQQLAENDLRHRLMKLDRPRISNSRNVSGNNQTDVGMEQRDPRMLDGNNQRDGRGVQRDPRMFDRNNRREGRVIQHDPRMMGGNNQREGIIMQRDPRMFDGNNQGEGIIMQHDPRMFDGNNQREERVMQRDPRIPNGNNPRMFDRIIQRDPRNGHYDARPVRNDQRDERNDPYDPRMNFENNQRVERDAGLINRDPRLFVGSDQGQTIIGQRDPRIFNGNNQNGTTIGHHDPRMSVGNYQYDPRLANRDPRLVAGNNQSDRGPRQMLDDNNLGRFVRSEFGLGTSNIYNFN